MKYDLVCIRQGERFSMSMNENIAIFSMSSVIEYILIHAEKVSFLRWNGSFIRISAEQTFQKLYMKIIFIFYSIKSQYLGIWSDSWRKNKETITVFACAAIHTHSTTLNKSFYNAFFPLIIWAGELVSAFFLFFGQSDSEC